MDGPCAALIGAGGVAQCSVQGYTCKGSIQLLPAKQGHRVRSPFKDSSNVHVLVASIILLKLCVCER